MPKERIFGLDLMRALAISLVIVSHTSLFFPKYNRVFTDALQVFGVYGVEIFFVLSGFLIGGILFNLIQTKDVGLKQIGYFWIRRWFRTLPLYFIILCLNIILVVSIKGEIPSKLWKYFLFLQNFKDEYLDFFPESWSLSIEEYAYLLAPLSLFLLYRLVPVGYNKQKVFLINALGLCLCSLVAKSIYYYNHLENHQTFIYWNFNLKPMVVYRLDAVFIGFILVYYFKKYTNFIKANRIQLAICGSVLLVILMASLIIYPISQYNTFYWNVLFLPLNSCALALILPHFYFLKLKSNRLKRLITKTSLYSYSMYLIHYSLLFIIINHFFDLSQFDIGLGTIFTLLYMAIVYLLSKISYTYLEKPLTDLRDQPRIKQFFN